MVSAGDSMSTIHRWSMMRLVEAVLLVGAEERWGGGGRDGKGGRGGRGGGKWGV